MILTLMAVFHKESLKDKFVDLFLSLTSGMGVYFWMPMQVDGALYLGEIIRSVGSIISGTAILLISLAVRHWYDNKYKKK